MREMQFKIKTATDEKVEEKSQPVFSQQPSLEKQDFNDLYLRSVFSQVIFYFKRKFILNDFFLFRLWPVPKFDFRVKIQLPKSERCSGCLKFKVPNLKKCNRCKYAKYCSQKCQMSDYVFHKMYCNKYFPKLRPDLEKAFLLREQIMEFQTKKFWNQMVGKSKKNQFNVTFEEVI